MWAALSESKMPFIMCYIELIMRKYRIKNYYNQGYVAQERNMIFGWYTFHENRLHGGYKIFNTKKEARDYIKERIQRDIEIKKAKYIEYV